MRISFEQDLQKIGFSEKESRVYLSSLALGPAPVQKIAEKSGVNRATTYVMIESLTARGLISSVQKGKKTLFIAESPKHLSHLIKNEFDAVESKKKILEKLVPQLAQITTLLAEQPKISLFEGLDGLRAIHEDLINFGKETRSIENIAAVDDARDLVLFDDMVGHWENLAKHKIKVRAIYTKSGKTEKIPDKFQHLWEERRISADKFPFHGEIVIYGDRVAALAFKGKILGFIIESHEVAQTLRVLFELAWDGSARHELK